MCVTSEQARIAKDESDIRNVLGIRPLKCVFINEHFLYWNGGARYLYEVTKRLAQWCKVDLIVQDISTENDRMFSDAGVEVCDMCETTANKLRYWLFYPYYLIKHSLILRGAQRLYNYDAWISSSPTTHIMCMLAGIKPILVVFELNPWLYNPQFIKGLSKTKQYIVKVAKIFAQFLEGLAYKNSKRIIVYSKYIQSEVKRVYNVESEVVYTGVDSDFFKPTHNAELEAKYKNNQVILHVASYLSPMKGTDLAVEAMGLVNKEFPNALLLIINSHNDIDRQYELHDKANICGANIDFVTSVKDEDLPVYYTMAKCLLSPSYDENVHLPVLEASACECIPIGLRGNSESEDIKDFGTGFNNSMFKGARGLAIATKVCVDEMKGMVLELMRKEARKFVKERFNWDKCLSEYKRIIGEVVNE